MDTDKKMKFGCLEYLFIAAALLIIASKIAPIALRTIILALTKPKQKISIEYNGKYDTCSYGPPYGCSIKIKAFEFGEHLGGSEIKLSGTESTNWNLLMDYGSDTGEIEINVNDNGKKIKILSNLDSAEYKHVTFDGENYICFGGLLDSDSDAINIKNGTLRVTAIIHGGKHIHNMYFFNNQFGYYTNRNISNETLK